MPITQDSATPFERLISAYLTRQLSDADFQILSACIEECSCFASSKTEAKPSQPGS